ncbi:MAG: sulfatase [Pseudomonadota bacterium]
MRPALLHALPIALLMGGCHDSRPLGPGEHPNIVIIDIDSLRADRLGAQRNGEPVAPTLDALAARGTIFSQAISQGGWTMPALASLMSGRFPLALRQGRQHRAVNWMPSGAPTLPALLAEQGYQTAFYAGISIAYAQNVASHFQTSLPMPPEGEPWRVAPLARWISEEAQEPFFALLHDQDLNLQMPDDDQEAVCRWAAEPAACLEVPRGPLPDDCQNPAKASGARDPAGVFAARYDGTLSLYDHALGGLVEAVERRGITERTLLVIMSDHGQELGEHGPCGHGYLYDTVLRIPLVIVDPRRAPGQEPIPWQVQTIDLLPTLLELAGVEAPAELDGLSLVPLLAGETPLDPARPAFSLSDRHIASLRAPPLKLWHADAGGGKIRRLLGRAGDADIDEVFDLDADPGERHDLGLGAPGAAAAYEALAAWRAARQAATAEPEEPDPELIRRLQQDGYWDHVDHAPPPPESAPPPRRSPTGDGAGAR